MLQRVNELQAVERLDEVQQYLGLKLIANGPPLSFIGKVCKIFNENHHPVMKAEVIGFAEGKVHLMPYHPALSHDDASYEHLVTD